MRINTTYNLTYTKQDLKNYAFTYVKGSRVSLDANKVYLDLCDFYKENPNSNLDAPEVFEWIKNHPESEMYKGIEWNDDRAAYLYRLHQCRVMVNQLRVIDITKLNNMELDEETRKKLTREVVTVTPGVPFYHIDGEKGYARTIDIISNQDRYNKLKQQALAELQSWRRRYEMINELSDLFEIIDKKLINM